MGIRSWWIAKATALAPYLVPLAKLADSAVYSSYTGYLHPLPLAERHTSTDMVIGPFPVNVAPNSSPVLTGTDLVVF
jgi:hypothetical protein